MTAKELLERLTDRPVTRRGDDLYLPRADGSDGKLSVSIATASATSRCGRCAEDATMPLDALDTPALVVDLDLLEANIAALTVPAGTAWASSSPQPTGSRSGRTT